MIQQKSTEEEISSLFKAAINKLGNIDAESNKRRSEIVKELAHNLEGKIQTDSIAEEIVHQLRGKVSERFIHECLEAKYKKKYRIENARKRKRQGAKRTLAALALLNKGGIIEETKGAVIHGKGNQSAVHPPIATYS